MKHLTAIISALAAAMLSAGTNAVAAPSIEPSATYLYAQKDNQDLFLDMYSPSKGTDTANKPVILFMFGGGFSSGSRAGEYYTHWFKMLSDNGFTVISIDYRLGMKDFKVKKVDKKFIDRMEHAINLAVEDLYSATLFLLDNQEELGIDANNIVISGCSAGAISAMQAEYYICSNNATAKVLPQDYNYSGVMSFAGAIYSSVGKIQFEKEPCPIFMAHGTNDGMVPYERKKVLNYLFSGSSNNAQILAKEGFPYEIYRYTGHGHEISVGMDIAFDQEMGFINSNVTCISKRVVDATIDDSTIPTPDWAKGSFIKLYK